jgi:hypothetical protein
MAALVPILVAQAAAQASRPLMGLSYAPTVVNDGDAVSIVIDGPLQDEMADFLIRQLDATPGAVRVDGLGGVLIKVLVRKYGLWAGGALASAFGLGWFTGKKK